MNILQNPISKRNTFYACILIPICFYLLGCASVYKKPRININQQPINPANIRADSIGIFNFNYLNEGENSKLSFAFAEFLQAELLKRNFIRVVGTTKCSYRNVDQAVELGQRMGYDLILIGEINKFYEGMRSSDSEVFITLRIIETKSSATLWYLTGQMSAKYHTGCNYVLFQTDTKPATSPLILGQSILKSMVETICSRHN
jgi:TolB-like protein